MLRRIILAFAGLIVLGVVALTTAVSYTADCPAPIQSQADENAMMGVYRPCYGSPEVLRYSRSQIPTPADDQILVKVEAASVNPLDSHFMRGSPYILRLFLGIGLPGDAGIGRDFAGTVVEVGDNVTELQSGDRVFGAAGHAFSEYLVRGATGSVARIPEEVSFEEAAGVPVAGVTALQALRDHGKLEPGQRVLINGASGGVGTYAVQIAKAMGAHVTGVCSGRNVELVKSIGADQVLNYKEENYLEIGQQFDLIVDMVGNHSPLENHGLLTPSGRLVIVGGGKGNWIAPFVTPIKASTANLFVDQELMTFTAQMLAEDLAAVADMMAAGDVRTVIDRHYALSETAEAMRYSESRRARGKIIIDLGIDKSGPRN
jgi:NADPH:quinone reductase-like Zn-dependent oxidoreductase